jgi:hypothetical protein
MTKFQIPKVASPRHVSQRFRPSGSKAFPYQAFDGVCWVWGMLSRLDLLKQWIRLATPNRLCGVLTGEDHLPCCLTDHHPAGSESGRESEHVRRSFQQLQTPALTIHSRHCFVLASAYCIGALPGMPILPSPCPRLQPWLYRVWHQSSLYLAGLQRRESFTDRPRKTAEYHETRS